jgi:hypothetical protein
MLVVSYLIQRIQAARWESSLSLHRCLNASISPSLLHGIRVYYNLNTYTCDINAAVEDPVDVEEQEMRLRTLNDGLNKENVDTFDKVASTSGQDASLVGICLTQLISNVAKTSASSLHPYLFSTSGI